MPNLVGPRDTAYELWNKSTACASENGVKFLGQSLSELTKPAANPRQTARVPDTMGSPDRELAWPHGDSLFTQASLGLSQWRCQASALSEYPDAGPLSTVNAARGAPGY